MDSSPSRKDRVADAVARLLQALREQESARRERPHEPARGASARARVRAALFDFADVIAE
jgi:hypothetical protein